MILASSGIIASQIQSFVGLLDLYPSAAAAYSLRKLRSAYTGSAIRVRRSSDNTEQDIGFTANQLNTSALTSFCGSGNGFVTTWYDQSGNTRNATQTTAANQPQIVSSGSIFTKNGKSTINFSLSTAPVCLDASFTSTNQYWAAFGVITPFTITSGLYYYGRWISVGTPGVQDYSSTSSFIGFVTSQNGFGASPPVAVVGYNNLFTTNAISFGNQYVVNVLKTANTVKSGLNNTLNSGFTQSGTLNATLLRLGANVSFSPENNSSLYGSMQEVIYYQTDQSTNVSNVNTNINTYYAIY